MIPTTGINTARHPLQRIITFTTSSPFPTLPFPYILSTLHRCIPEVSDIDSVPDSALAQSFLVLDGFSLPFHTATTKNHAVIFVDHPSRMFRCFALSPFFLCFPRPHKATRTPLSTWSALLASHRQFTGYPKAICLGCISGYV